MVSTRRSRSAGGDSDSQTPVQASQDEVSSHGKASASKQRVALEPINEEPAPPAQSPTGSEQHKQTPQRRRRVQLKQQYQQRQQHEDEQQQLLQPQQQQLQQPQQQQQHEEQPHQQDAVHPSEGQLLQVGDTSSDADDDMGLDFDGPEVLQNLAAAIRSGFQSQSHQQQQQRSSHAPTTTAAAAAAAAGAATTRSKRELDDTELQQLRWRPHTGLQLPAGAAAAMALTRPRQRKQLQQQDEPLGALVDPPSAAQAAGAKHQQQGGEATAAAATKQPGLSKALHAPTLDAAARAKDAKKTAPDTAGSKWYDLPAPKMTDELKRDLRLLRLRGAYDPKRFYKSFDNTKFPKYFAVGTVVDDPLDNNRLSKGQRRATLTEQLLADNELTTTRKRRYNKLQDEAQKWVKAKKRKTSQPRKTPAKHRPKH